MEDKINKPYHYNQGSIQPYDFIVANYMSYTEGSIIKYITRYKYKDSPLDDLKKARYYLEKLIKDEETKENGR